MKKKIIILLYLLFTVSLFANPTTRKVVNNFISEKNLTIIVRSGDYTLTADEKGTFFLFSEDFLYDKVDIYMEVEKVTRDEVSKIVREADGASKVIELNNYIVLNAYQFIGDWYFVKTPKGNYYNVSYKLLSIPAILDDF